MSSIKTFFVYLITVKNLTDTSVLITIWYRFSKIKFIYFVLVRRSGLQFWNIAINCLVRFFVTGFEARNLVENTRNLTYTSILITVSYRLSEIKIHLLHFSSSGPFWNIAINGLVMVFVTRFELRKLETVIKAFE